MLQLCLNSQKTRPFIFEVLLKVISLPLQCVPQTDKFEPSIIWYHSKKLIGP